MTRSLLVSLAAAAVLVTACGTDPVSTPSAAPAATSPTAPSPTLTNTEGPAELQFTVKTINGQDFSGESLLGEPAVMWFWAPWCPVCQREAPMVGQIASANPGVRFVGVAAMDQLPAMQEFVATHPVSGFTHLADTDGAVWAKFGVTHQPAYAFVSADGDIDVVRGSLSQSELTERVTALPSQ
jgi:thiol-disulfide isomerase/thioredoxin